MIELAWLEYFSHPLVLLLIGAGLTGVITPYITDRWQKSQRQVELKREDHKWALEVKGKIVNRIAECVMIIIVSLERIEDEISEIRSLDLSQKTVTAIEINKSIEEIEQKYSQLKVTASVIKTELETYFNEVHLKWGHLYSTRIKELIDKTYEDLGGAQNSKIHFSRKSWDEMKNKILLEKHDLLEEIHRSNIKGLE